jgi:hypothetical protein
VPACQQCITLLLWQDYWMAEKPKPDPLFVEQITPLEEAAIAMHEQYSAFLSAGFTAAQSMQILISMTEAMMYKNEVDDEYDD